MGLREKLTKAATEAALEATVNEQGRILWLMDDMETSLVQDFEKKLLAESQRELARVKLEIARRIFRILRMRIASGERPPKKDDNGQAMAT